MNAIGLALVWCVLQVTLLGLLASGLYLVVRLWRPSAAVPVVLTGLGIVVVLSLMAVSPWPQWTILGASPSAGKPTIEAMPEVDAVTPEPPDEPAFSLSEGPIAEASGEEPPPVKKQPSAVARLWESIVRQLVAPDAASATAWRWPATVAVVLLAAMLCGLGWFVLGVLAVRGERLRSRTVENQELLELVDVLRAELACRRPIEVRQSDGLVTAATIGWRRPVLLLPAEWTTWTADQRRAVLAHEIAHVRSQDFLALLLGQLGLVLHFYHPLMHWLMNRLRLEQELAADAAAANVLGGRREYLATIAELALRQEDRPLAWPARSFLPTQTTFLRRIAVLRDSKRRFDRLSPAARVVAVGIVLLGGLMIAGLRGPTGQQALADDAEKASPANAANTVVEGVGWKGARVGATLEELVKALGRPDPGSTPDWPKWNRRLHIECTFQGSGRAREIRFHPGFKGALANGIKVGSPADEVAKHYGKPEHVTNQAGGAVLSEYSQKGILFWTYQGKIAQFTVFKPYKLQTGQPPSNQSSGKAAYAPGSTQTGAALARPGSEAALKQIESLARTAEAWQKARSVHIAAQMRTLPQDNFSHIDANREFVPIEIWKEFGDKPKWRVEKPQRVAVMDGNSTVMMIRQQTVVKLPQAASSAFDNYWLVGLCDTREIIDRELRSAVAKGWDVKVAEETSGGEEKLVVTVESKSGLSDNDHLKNKFYMTSDLRLVYRFHAKTARLDGFEAYLHQADGDTKIFATEHIEYDQPIDPKVFALEIPKTALEYKEPQRLPDNEKYEKMTPLEAARAFFEACHKEDWKEAEKFQQPLTDEMKQYLGGLEVVHLGEPFKPKLYAGWMIPYEIKFKNGGTKKWNLAMRKDNPARRYVVDGGL